MCMAHVPCFQHYVGAAADLHSTAQTTHTSLRPTFTGKRTTLSSLAARSIATRNEQSCSTLKSRPLWWDGPALIVT